MTTTITFPVTISASALEEIKKLSINASNADKTYLRIGVQGGGCAGFSYILEFDNISENDEKYEYHGLKIAIDKTQAIYLEGISIDFKRGLDNRGFIFDNPNATSTCGCGSSFSA